LQHVKKKIKPPFRKKGSADEHFSNVSYEPKLTSESGRGGKKAYSKVQGPEIFSGVFSTLQYERGITVCKDRESGIFLVIKGSFLSM